MAVGFWRVIEDFPKLNQLVTLNAYAFIDSLLTWAKPHNLWQLVYSYCSGKYFTLSLLTKKQQTFIWSGQQDTLSVAFKSRALCRDIGYQFSSVAQSCPTLCDPVNRSMPGLPVHHQLPEFTQTHVHRVSDAIQPSHSLSSPSPSAPNPSQHQSLFQWVNSSHELAKVLEFQL